MKRSLRRAVSLLCVLAMCIGLLPSTALAWGEQTLVRIYVEGTGTPEYNLTGVMDKEDNILPSGGALKVEENFIITDLDQIVSGADNGIGADTPEEAQQWVKNHNVQIPNIEAVKHAVEKAIVQYNWNDIDFDVDGYSAIQVTYVTDWISSDRSYHVHLNLVPKNITVTYHGNGGTYEGNETREDTWEYDAAGYTVQSDEYGFKRDGYAFVRWYLDKECTEEVSGPIHTTEDIDLYAKWEKTGPDITVTKELTSVVRDGKTITEGLGLV